MFNRFKKPEVKQEEKDNKKCGVEFKRDKNGRINRKYIVGNCSPSELKALGMINQQEEEPD